MPVLPAESTIANQATQLQQPYLLEVQPSNRKI